MPVVDAGVTSVDAAGVGRWLDASEPAPELYPSDGDPAPPVLATAATDAARFAFAAAAACRFCANDAGRLTLCSLSVSGDASQ